MRRNYPVTQVNHPLGEKQSIISATDARGVIRAVNQDFIDIAGFTEAELIGQAHNLIRHPDMPQAAFQLMWDYLKAGHHWVGIVKNRCKNGDHYWVNAHVTPIYEDGKICGYESVRVKPTAGQVSRAEAVYARLNAGKKPFSLWQRFLPRFKRILPLWLVLATPGALTLMLAFAALWPALGVMTATALLALLFDNWQQQWLMPADKCDAAISQDAITQFIFTGEVSNLGRYRLQQIIDQSALRTITGMVEHSSHDVVEKSHQVAENARHSSHSVQQLSQETDQIAVAIEELSASVEQISQSVNRVSADADASRQLGENGRSVLQRVMALISSQHDHLVQDAEQAQALDQLVAEIGTIASSIDAIAEKTNLLALNAAIEAARAGEAGRGFAVVADEVRSLASDTQRSTERIQSALTQIQQQVTGLVQRMQEGRDGAATTHDEMQSVSAQLVELLQSVDGIASSAQEMAAGAEQQSKVSTDIAARVSQIRDNTVHAAELIDADAELSRQMDEAATSQLELVSRFSR
ncbi:hypothetical protein CHH28_17060 [Bacterioplanes sanyensis]|uniref:Chemotaxis protein n=1 Tax=Bacterioplanes sanyensis TaxID=1249553 RepID=A0A222FNB4_9GAMM|nr:PAS domain-containing methyl-accepting chemotaxis protein [Bacterioplanes sanyensis]ASP40280.1 hypothetical protein CHH28_17060 [Bacterioplanes sanyensis]